MYMLGFDSVTLIVHTGDWVEMSSDEEVNDKDKLKVVVTPRLVTPSSSKSIEQGPKLESESVADAPNGAISKWRLQPRRLGSDEESDAETVTTPKTRKRVVSDSDDGDTTGTGDSSSIASTSSGVPVKKRRTIEKSKKDSVPLPDPFPLPKHHSVEVEMAIKEKKFSNVARQAFVGKVAAAMLFYKRYPTSEDYSNVGRTVIQKYLCLKSPIGTPAGAIITSLKNSFKEFRRDKSKKRTPSSTSNPRREKPLPPGKAVSLLSPEIPSGEDETSFARHNKILQLESKKLQPNAQIVKELMALSFAMRRDDILEHDRDVQTLFEMYPFLNRVDQILEDMQQIVGDESWCSTAQLKWEEVTKKDFESGVNRSSSCIRVVLGGFWMKREKMLTNT